MHMKIVTALVAILAFTTASADEIPLSTYESLVDETGTISLPKNLRRDWAFLGTWSIAEEDVVASSEASSRGAAGLHNVYTQPATIDHFLETGKFPDGAVIVKELLKTVTTSMTTGTVSRGTKVEGWFVMVKDTQGRFESSPLWGDGWGWSLFNADQTETTVTTNYKTECIGCHIPARKDDWIYLSGYPILKTAN